jgi:hypothetical protein
VSIGNLSCVNTCKIKLTNTYATCVDTGIGQCRCTPSDRW